MTAGIRGLIKQATIARLSKYTPVRLGMSSDELINAALDVIEGQRVKLGNKTEGGSR